MHLWNVVISTETEPPNQQELWIRTHDFNIIEALDEVIKLQGDPKWAAWKRVDSIRYRGSLDN